MQFWIDFQKINAILKSDVYPMLWVDDFLHQLGAIQYVTTLKLINGCWQILLIPASREKTASDTPFGLYKFHTISFELHGAPATFQRLMDHVLETHQGYVAVYLRDLVVYSQTWAEHLDHTTWCYDHSERWVSPQTQPSVTWVRLKPHTRDKTWGIAKYSHWWTRSRTCRNYQH